MSHCRVITITEDDLDLIKGGPSVRRSFLNQALILLDITHVTVLRLLRATLEKRKAVLSVGHCTRELYDVLTQQLWERSQVVQQACIVFLSHLQNKVNELIKVYFSDAFQVTLNYKPKRDYGDASFEEFQKIHEDLYESELRNRRSLFGAHLDDVTILFRGKRSRSFASRGQQKLLVLLLKAAQVCLLPQSNTPTVLLLDDFMTDLDPERAKAIFTMLIGLGAQLIFTTPSKDDIFEQLVREQGAHVIMLDGEGISTKKY